MLRSILLFVFCLALTACGSESADPTPTPAEPNLENGVQVVTVEAGPTGYDPVSIKLEAGVPTRLILTRTVDSECSSQVKIPAFDVPATDLPLNEPVALEFTPTESGDFEFVCGMDMQRGSLLIQS